MHRLPLLIPLTLVAAAVISWAGDGHAAQGKAAGDGAYPSKPIRFIIPFPPAAPPTC